MRILNIAVIAAIALAGIAVPAFADGWEPGTSTLRVPINGRTNQQICRAAQALGVLPGSFNECVREARANREEGWVTLTVLAGPMLTAEPTAQPAAVEEPPVIEELQPLADPPARTEWTPSREQQILIGLLLAAAVLGPAGYFFFRKKPEAEALIADEETT